MVRRWAVYLALPIVVTASLPGCAGLQRTVAERFLVPRTEWHAEPSDAGLAFEDVVLPTGDETSVHGWFIPARAGGRAAPAARSTADVPPADGRTVVFCHGNAANISFYHPYYTFLHEGGWNVMLHDYRGYGRSRGATDVAALFSDTEAILDSVLARPDVAPGKVVLFGTSLGAIVALRTAARRPEVAAVVVENASSPGEVLGRGVGVVGAWLVTALALPGGLEPADNAARIERPQLYLCGEHDGDLAAHLRAFAAARGPAAAWVLPDTGHAPHPLLLHDGEYQQQVLRFLDAALAGDVPRVDAIVASADADTLRVTLTQRDLPAQGPLPVEVCVVGADGAAHFTRRWMRSAEEHWDVPGVAEPTSVTAWPYVRVTGTPEGETWQRAPGPLADAVLPHDTLLASAAIVAEARVPLPSARAFVATLATFEARGRFPALLEAELVPAWLTVGRVLAASADPADRAAARALLERCVAAAPAQPGLHYWPAPRYVAGFAHAADVAEARALLAALADGRE